MNGWIAMTAGGAALCVLLVTYPYLIYPALLRMLPTKPIRRVGPIRARMTLAFCAFNEAAVMPEKLANIQLLKSRYGDLEVLAFDDGSTDSTFEQLAAQPDLLTVVKSSGRNGKAHGMKLLAARATGDILVFTDANVMLKDDALENLVTYFSDPAVGGVCGSLRYIGAEESAAAAVGSLYWRLEEHLKNEESRTGNVMGADGSIFAIRRELYPAFPDTVLDDLTVSMATVFAGYRLIKAEDVIAYERAVVLRQEEFARKVRIAARAFHTHLFLTPQLRRMGAVDKFKYISRKIVRWFGGLFLVVGAVLAGIAAALLSPSLLVAGAFVLASLVWIGMKTRSGPIASIVEIVIALLATLLGVYKAIRGYTFTVWNPAKSR